MSEHTKEPWRHVGQGDIVGANDDDVCAVYFHSQRPVDANARRIVACVNACAGISTEKLEGPGMLVNIPDDHNIIAQRDELLARLQSALSFIEGFENDDSQEGIDDLLADIRASILASGGKV